MKIFPALCLTSLACLITACSGGGSHPTPPPTPPAISVALSSPPTSLAASATAPLTAIVTNDSVSAGVAWSATCATAPCGTFNPTTTASGAPTTYQAPSTAGTVTVIATSVTDKTKAASAPITVTPPPVTILKDGTYVFHVAGSDANSQYFIAGAFTVKGGLITGGEQDFLDLNLGQTDQISATGSTLAKTADGNIQIILNTGDTNIGVKGIETFNGTAVSSARVLISESDTFATGAGSVDLQTGTAAPSGGYAFAVLGLDSQKPQQLLGIGGVLNFNGTSLVTSGSIFDCNDAGAPSLAQPFTSGTITAPDAFGRVTVTLNPASVCLLTQMTFGGYIIGPNQIQIVESGQDTFQGTLAGVALGQGGQTGKFSATSVNNTAYVFSSFGEDGNGTLTLAGGFIFNSTGILGGNLAINDLVVSGGNTITGGSFVVDPTGRITLANVMASGNLNPVTLQFQLYLDGNGNALELGVDSIQLSSGMAYLQTTSAFLGPRNYGLLAQGFVPTSTTSSAYWSAVGPQTLTTDAFTGFVDYNTLGSPLQTNIALNATVDTTKGLITLGGLDPNNQTDGFGYYAIDNSRLLAIEVDGNQLGLLQIEGLSTH